MKPFNMYGETHPQQDVSRWSKKRSTKLRLAIGAQNTFHSTKVHFTLVIECNSIKLLALNILPKTAQMLSETLGKQMSLAWFGSTPSVSTRQTKSKRLGNLGLWATYTNMRPVSLLMLARRTGMHEICSKLFTEHQAKQTVLRTLVISWKNSWNGHGSIVSGRSRKYSTRKRSS